MPRLTDTEYLIRHDLVQRVWRRDNSRLGYLAAKQQRDIHDYYQTTREASDQELLKHRAHVTEHDPSLPHRASRAFLALLRPPARVARSGTRPSKSAVARPVLNPEIDIERLAASLMEFVAALPQEERDRLAEEGRLLRERREKEVA